MSQKIIIFEEKRKSILEQKINEFAKMYHIENISYSVVKYGYEPSYSCCVLYTNK